MQTGIEQATGRTMTCPACRKPLPQPEGNKRYLLCSVCHTETFLEPNLPPLEDDSLYSRSPHDFGRHDDDRINTYDQTFPHERMILPSAGPSRREADPFDDDFEIKLEPESERTAFTPSLPNLSTAPISIVGNVGNGTLLASSEMASSPELDPQARADQAKQTYNATAGMYPRERHYPTLEAMQRLYRLFGYVAVLCVFPYIGMRFLYLLLTTKEQHFQVMAEFLEFAVPVLFGCVALTASLFAVSEGIRLAIDIQDNTLRIANSTGRHRP